MAQLVILLGIIGVQEMILLLFLVPILTVIPVVLCVKRAEKIGRDKAVWGIFGFLFGYIAVLIAYMISPEKTRKEHITLCRFCGEEIHVLAKKCKHCGEWLDSK